MTTPFIPYLNDHVPADIAASFLALSAALVAIAREPGRDTRSIESKLGEVEALLNRLF